MPRCINYQVFHSSMLEKKLTVVKLTTIDLKKKKKKKKRLLPPQENQKTCLQPGRYIIFDEAR